MIRPRGSVALKEEPGKEMEKQTLVLVVAIKRLEKSSSDAENAALETRMSSRTCTPKERKEGWQRV